jgi:hypothetical protein
VAIIVEHLPSLAFLAAGSEADEVVAAVAAAMMHSVLGITKLYVLSLQVLFKKPSPSLKIQIKFFIFPT